MIEESEEEENWRNSLLIKIKKTTKMKKKTMNEWESDIVLETLFQIEERSYVADLKRKEKKYDCFLFACSSPLKKRARPFCCWGVIIDRIKGSTPGRSSH